MAIGPSMSSATSESSRRIQLDVRALRAQAKIGFARVGIAPRHLDRAVLECVIAASNKSIDNPLGYCLAVGRRLQDETDRRAWREQRAQRLWIENACPHGAVDVQACPPCAEDRARALELFPFLRRFLSESVNSAGVERDRS